MSAQSIYYQVNSLRELDHDQVPLAIAHGCREMEGLIRDLPIGSVIVGHTNEIGGWTGVYKKEVGNPTLRRIARYRDFSRTLRHAKRLIA